MTAKLAKAVRFVVYNAAGLLHKTRNIRNHKYLCTKWQPCCHSLVASCRFSPKNAFTLETKLKFFAKFNHRESEFPSHTHLIYDFLEN